MAGDKFCLKWNDFESHMSGSFREIRDAKDFFDVTLVCDDDQQIQAHKVIISACSPFFRNLLRRNPHQHPLIYLRGVRFHELESLLNFMYHGESNIAQTDLNSFLAVAEEFQVKGLTQSQSGDKAPPPPTPPHKPVSTKKPKPILPKPSPAPVIPAVPITPRDDELLPVKTELTYHEDSNQDQEMIDDVQLVDYPEESWIAEDEYEADTSYDLAAASASFVQGTDSKGPTDPSELGNYLEKDGKNFVCTICKVYSSTRITNAKNHVEAKHFPNHFTYDCIVCCSTFKSKIALYNHTAREHNKKENSFKLECVPQQ